MTIDDRAVLSRARDTMAHFAAAVSAAPGLTAVDSSALTGLDAAQILNGRAILNGLRSNGRISPGGATRLLEAVDGWVALTLSREDDLALLPALFSLDEVPADPWPTVQDQVAALTVEEFASRVRLLGLPGSALGEIAPAPPRIRPRGEPVARRTGPLLVADLSSLWAGPLCGQLLTRAGARVVKVESPARPDGARRGNPVFFDWMNGGKLSYAVPFTRDSAGLAALLRRADVVIEASRPRALRQLGLAAQDLEPAPGQVWLRITAYGPDEPQASWVGFGDDTAVAGGLVRRTETGPEFCGDAIADPLTGVTGARLVAQALAEGGGRLIDVSLAGTVAVFAAEAGGRSPTGGSTEQAPPAPPAPTAKGPDLGADNAEVEALITEG